MKQFCLGTVLLATTILCTAAPGAPARKTPDGILANVSGMTLYTFDMDMAGKSNCNGACAALWPPELAGADARPEGELSIIERDDGSKQWAYRGKPVYTFSKDLKAGDKAGDNVKNVWHVVQ